MIYEVNSVMAEMVESAFFLLNCWATVMLHLVRLKKLGRTNVVIISQRLQNVCLTRK